MNEQPRNRSRSALPWLVAGVLLLAAIANRHAVLDQDPRIAPRELQAAMRAEDAPLVLDIRSAAEYAGGHIPGAVHVPPGTVEDFARTVKDPHQPVVLYCETGSRSRAARYALKDLGFTDLTQLEGDMRAWRRLDLPVRRAPSGPS